MTEKVKGPASSEAGMAEMSELYRAKGVQLYVRVY